MLQTMATTGYRRYKKGNYGTDGIQSEIIHPFRDFKYQAAENYVIHPAKQQLLTHLSHVRVTDTSEPC